jgi:peptide deformylase
MRLNGLLSRVFQHEVDHLEGILFIKRIPFWRKWKMKNKLKKEH